MGIAERGLHLCFFVSSTRRSPCVSSVFHEFGPVPPSGATVPSQIKYCSFRVERNKVLSNNAIIDSIACSLGGCKMLIIRHCTWQQSLLFRSPPVLLGQVSLFCSGEIQLH